MYTQFKFQEISQQLAAAAPSAASAMPVEFVNLIASLALRWSGRAEIDRKTDKELWAEIDLYLGYGILCKEAIRLVVALARLCRKVEDGSSKEAVVDYLNRRLHIAMIHYPVIGRELPKMLAEKIAGDIELLDQRSALRDVLAKTTNQ